MAETRRITVKILRGNPGRGQEPHYEDFRMEVPAGMSVTDVLKEINRTHDGGIAYRVSCRRGVCGTCTVKMNGKPGLACCREVTGDLVLEPAFPGNVIKDLVSNSGSRDSSKS